MISSPRFFPSFPSPFDLRRRRDIKKEEEEKKRAKQKRQNR
jgi:hypothetical protein